MQLPIMCLDHDLEWKRNGGEKEFFDSLATHLNLKEKDDWYRVNKEEVFNFGGEAMLKKVFAGSVRKALQVAYPDHKWLPWKFDSYLPRKTWGVTQSRRDFLNNMAKELGIVKMEDWYEVSVSQIREKGGSALLRSYQDSPAKMISSILIDHKWNLRKFNCKITGVWDNLQLQKDFMNNVLGKELNIKTMDDWYDVGVAQIRAKGGGGLLRRYYNSPFLMITSVLKDHPWNRKDFNRKPKVFWDDQMQRDFLGRLTKHLNIIKMEDWYTVSKFQIYQQGGGGLLRRYQNSPSKMITSIMTEHDWDIQNFTSKASGTWDDIQMQKDFINHLTRELNIHKMEDWYHVTRNQICNKGGAKLLERYWNLPSKMITTILSEHNWDIQKFSYQTK
eukprot:TRINITY_DN2763_c0_g1_i1.p1 TRINITY_DN2763_c0_g1~~TRINITY_DN2763_c0_g1_i1.p1  ORF type:complete len:389 (+),score=75.72 TRINITY_DN2763_c0_g1_i1:90-1256(+)